MKESVQYILRNIRGCRNIIHFETAKKLIDVSRANLSKEDINYLENELRYSLEMRGFTIESIFPEYICESVYTLEVEFS